MTFTVKTFTALPERSLALTTVSYHGCLEAVHPSPVIYKTHMHKGKEVWIISSFPATLRKPCSTGFVGRFFFLIIVVYIVFLYLLVVLIYSPCASLRKSP